MKHTHIFSFAILALGVILNSCKGQKATISAENNTVLSVTYTSEYCGGAQPDEDILEQLMVPKPMGKETVYIFNNKNPEAITGYELNKDGKVALNLKAGKYTISKYNHFQVAKDVEEFMLAGAGESGGCPPDWKFQISNELEVKESGGEYTTNLHLICDPCAEPRP